MHNAQAIERHAHAPLAWTLVDTLRSFHPPIQDQTPAILEKISQAIQEKMDPEFNPPPEKESAKKLDPEFVSISYREMVDLSLNLGNRGCISKCR